MNTERIIERLRAHPVVKDTDAVGMASSFGHDIVVKEVDERNRFIETTVNTADVDLDDEVVVPSGLDPKAYFLPNQGRVFVDHMYDLGSHVGVTRHLNPFPSSSDHRAWRAVVRLLNTPLANDVLTVAREAGIGASVGFKVDEMGPPDEDEQKRYGSKRAVKNVIRRATMLEFSFTAMPCNVSCQGRAAMDESKAAVLDELVSKSKIRPESGYALGLPKGERRRATKTIRLLEGGGHLVITR